MLAEDPRELSDTERGDDGARRLAARHVEAQVEAPAGAPFVIRLKAPLEGETVIEDQVQGRVAVNNAELDDFVLLRSDGTPTYMLAVVVDDHDMGVTHVIRGDDHLNNAFRQLQIIRAMGWPEPVYAHIPLIHGPDGAKLSKRDNALSLAAGRDLKRESGGLLYRALRFLGQELAVPQFDHHDEVAGMLKSPRKIAHRMNRAGYVQVPPPDGEDRWVFRREGKTIRARYAFVRSELSGDTPAAHAAVRARGEVLLDRAQDATNVVPMAAKKG